MITTLSNLSFANPWILAALLALPAIWWLIRLTPPAPKIVQFPAIQFLLQLQRDEKSSASIPWWLLIIRLLIASLIIVGLSAPVFNLPNTGKSNGPVVIIIDNGWASASGWPQRKATLIKLTEDLFRQKRLTYIIPTAAKTGETAPVLTPLKPENLPGIEIEFTPRAWTVDRSQLNLFLQKFETMKNVEFLWLTDGFSANTSSAKLETLFSKIAAIGPLTIYRDENSVAPHVIGSPIPSNNKISVPIFRPPGSVNLEGTLIARAENGKILVQKPYQFEPEATKLQISIELPGKIRNDIARLDIKETKSAGSLFLLDNRWQRREIGLVADDLESLGQSLLSETHYLEKALSPFYDIQKNTLTDLMTGRVSLIALGDVAAFSAKTRSQLENWIQQGGVLIRFSGPKLANSLTNLVPVELRSGNRNLDGTMSWSKPAALGPMPENSPFANLTIDPEIKVNKQVLANPSSDLNRKTWARLEDGTPLVTADKREKGWIVLFHTTATTNWSDLVLSGLFVEMLREIGHLGTINNSGILAEKSLSPLNLLNGFGHFEGSISTAKPLNASTSQQIKPSAEHPAGFYGSDAYKLALNIGPGIEEYQFIDFSRIPGKYENYGAKPVVKLQAPLLLIAFVLILLDLLIALALQGRLSFQIRSSRTFSWVIPISVIVLSSVTADKAWSEENIQRLLDATLDTRLAYILTGDDSIDQMSEAGLYGLSVQLRRRTAIEAANPLAVNIEQNELIFYPLIYWPVTADFPIISDAAITRINQYIKGGGTILFDTRDQFSVGIFSNGSFGSPESVRLRQMLSRLDIPNLSSVSVDHVLTRSFYLMQSFPGRYSDGELWIENTTGATGNDGVASILIGSNDWAAAWATNKQGVPLAAVIPGGDRQREMAMRFGINLVMYTLAGNYKADQVHIPAILERLGQ